MLVVYSGNFGEVFVLCTKLLHVFSASIAKELRRSRGIRYASGLLHHFVSCHRRVGSVVEVILQTTRTHLLETNDKYTVSGTVRDSLSAHMQTGRASAAVVVYVVYRDLTHTELVEDRLPTC